MNKETILGIIRHVLTFGGGVLATKGIATGSEIEQAVAAIVALAGVIWSILAKRNAPAPLED